ncbi:hypothetical protein D3C87_1260230 [compost metagenome]
MTAEEARQNLEDTYFTYRITISGLDEENYYFKGEDNEGSFDAKYNKSGEKYYTKQSYGWSELEV